jgi:hypothetical protein
MSWWWAPAWPEDGRVRAVHIIRAEDKLAALDLHPDLI